VTSSMKEGRFGSLRENAMGVVGAVAISMAFMGPATSVFNGTAPAVSNVGYAFPLAMLLALIVCLLVASAIAAFAEKIPTAGFAYTFNTRGFGKRGGFLSGWILALSYAMVGPMLFAAFGALAAQFLQNQWGVNIPWWIFTIAAVVAIWAISALGINRSAETALIFLVLEVGVVTALLLTIVGKGGAQGLTLAPFNPAQAHNGISGLGLGLLWSILAFVGFESAGTLGEETARPRHSIPVALFAAVGVIGLFYLLAAYAASVGFGSSHVGKFMSDPTPFNTLGSRYWGSGLLWILSLTVLNSVFANLISGCNAFVRVFFAMGREGIFARALGRTTSDGVPIVALTSYMAFALALALIGGALWNPFGAYGFYGTILGLGIVITYILINLALIRFYQREHPAEFSPIRHGLLPIVASLLMLLPVYGIIWPVPAYPDNLVPYIMVGWIIVGAIYLAFIVRSRPEVMDAMGRVMGEKPEREPGYVPAVRTGDR